MTTRKQVGVGGEGERQGVNTDTSSSSPAVESELSAGRGLVSVHTLQIKPPKTLLLPITMTEKGTRK